MGGSKKGSGYGGMARAACTNCRFVFLKSSRQIATGKTDCVDRQRCERRRTTGKRTPKN